MKQVVISMILISMLGYTAIEAQLPPAPTIVSVVSNKVPCGRNNGSITVVATGNPIGFTLLDENNMSVQVILSRPDGTGIFVGLKNGLYRVRANNAGGSSTSVTVVVKNPLCPALILCCSCCR